MDHRSGLFVSALVPELVWPSPVAAQTFRRQGGPRCSHSPHGAVEIPWNLELGDDVVIGDYAIVYSIGKITIGRSTNISQYSHLCACTHDYTTRRFPLLKPPIVIGDEVWIAADAFIGPGVTVGDRAVVAREQQSSKMFRPIRLLPAPKQNSEAAYS